MFNIFMYTPFCLRAENKNRRKMNWVLHENKDSVKMMTIYWAI